MLKVLLIMLVLAYTMCQDTLSEPASVQIHLFFKFNIVSWLNFCLCAYSHRFFRNNSVIQIYVWWLGTLLLAWVSLQSHLCSSSNSASTSVDLCRDTSDTTQICCDTSDTTQKMSVYLRKSWKCRYILDTTQNHRRIKHEFWWNRWKMVPNHSFDSISKSKLR